MLSLDVVLLAGGPRRPPIEIVTGIPVHRLSLGLGTSMLDCWQATIGQAICRSRAFGSVSWTVLLSSGSVAASGSGSEGVRFVCEQRGHRGAAGAIKDLLDVSTDEPGLVLVVELSASPVVDLESLLNASSTGVSTGACCVVGESALRRYCGVSLGSRAMFDRVPDVGFFDFKEQLLPMLYEAGVKIVPMIVAKRARRVRTRMEWIQAMQAWNQGTASWEAAVACPSVRPPLNGGVSLISSSASTMGATVVSSIVMDEAVVEPGALVARSVIGPGMRVPAGTRVIDAVLADPAAGDAAIRRSGASGTVSVASE